MDVEPDRGAAVPGPPAVPQPPTVPEPPTGHASPRREPSPSDLFAHSLGLSPANTPAPATPALAPDPSTPTRARRPGRGAGPTRRRVFVAAVAVAVLAGAGTAVGFAVTGDSPAPVVAASRSASPSAPSTGSSSAPVGASAAADAAAWLSLNVVPPRRIVAIGADLGQDLQGEGLAVATVGVDDALDVGVVVVRLADPAATPTAVAPVTPTGRSIVPLARFGSGSQTVAVGQVVGGTPEAVQGELDAAAAVAVAACRGVSDNAAVTIATGVRPVFDAGTLDLRASTLLAVIARTQAVTVVAAPQDPAEQAAGRPVRVIVVQVADRDALQTTAVAAQAPYLATVGDPPADLDVPDGSVLLSWAPNAAATLRPS